MGPAITDAVLIPSAAIFDCRSQEALDYYRQLEEEERQQREAAEKAAEAASAAESFKLLDIDGDGIIRYSV